MSRIKDRLKPKPKPRQENTMNEKKDKPVKAIPPRLKFAIMAAALQGFKGKK